MAWSLMMIRLSIMAGIQHDQVSYTGQWRLVLSGNNPWATDNAYGPLHSLLAYLLFLGPYGPKLALVLAFLGANTLLVQQLAAARGKVSLADVYTLIVPTNFLVIATVCVFGLNDSLVAALVVGAAVARFRCYLLLSGCLLGLAVLLKYYPIFLVPLFAVDDRRFKISLVAGAAVTTVVGLGAALLAWGDSVLIAPLFGHARSPRMLSVLFALETNPGLVGGPVVLAALARINTICVLVVGAGSVLIALKRHLHWLEASVLGLLAVLLTYKVGHQQFYLPWLCLVAALPLTGTPSGRRLARLCLPLVMFLSAFQLSYFLGDEVFTQLEQLRRYAGFAVLFLGAWILVAYFWPPRAPAGAIML